MYAPVAKMASIRTILALAAQMDYEIHQIDVKNAYLNGEFEEGEVVYMKLPPEVQLTNDKTRVCRLLKPLYGLKQAGRYWYKKMRRELEGRLQLMRCEVDHAVFAMGEGKKKEDEKAMVVAHVDDLTLVTSRYLALHVAAPILPQSSLWRFSSSVAFHYPLDVLRPHQRYSIPYQPRDNHLGSSSKATFSREPLRMIQAL